MVPRRLSVDMVVGFPGSAGPGASIPYLVRLAGDAFRRAWRPFLGVTNPRRPRRILVWGGPARADRDLLLPRPMQVSGSPRSAGRGAFIPYLVRLPGDAFRSARR